MAYGQYNESVARTLFIEKLQKAVRPAGLFIDEEFGFLGASPDDPGQLRVCKMQKCYFVGYISPTYDITVLEIERDENFIRNMLPKLEVSFLVVTD
ncbi:hypothetical protein MSG28_012609 [Choristoneura fumiferana]|uniref:Uncharacterized protein n=1 Tax=Choristoneura fumiferana TaxID=7141 RepID=A0ACC0JHB1_CHOFU|nr:hypothetical protein MSG28_012609 [Choristoneura fumiferana]